MSGKWPYFLRCLTVSSNMLWCKHIGPANDNPVDRFIVHVFSPELLILTLPTDLLRIPSTDIILAGNGYLNYWSQPANLVKPSSAGAHRLPIRRRCFVKLPGVVVVASEVDIKLWTLHPSPHLQLHDFLRQQKRRGWLLEATYS